MISTRHPCALSAALLAATLLTALLSWAGDPAAARSRERETKREDGVLSRVNRHGAALGLAPGMPAREAVALLRRAFAKETNR